MSNPFFQGVNPDPVPDPVTPVTESGDPAGWAKVTPEENLTAPYDIAAPQDITGITGAFDAANALAGAGVNVAPSMGPRQHETMTFLDSPQGIGAMDITAGFPDYEDTDIRPSADLETPIQGHGYHPDTTQDGIPFYPGPVHGLEGVPPESGSMETPGGNYPGTEQSGLPMYGGK